MTHLEAETSVLASNNPFLLDGNDNGAAATELTVRPEIRWSLPPGTSVQLAGQASYRAYTRRYGDFFTGNAHGHVAHRHNEFLSLESRVSFARELPADALTESIDYSIDSTTVRERLLASSAVRWNPGARTEVTGTGTWEKLRYPGSALLSSTSARQFNLRASHRVSPYTSLGIEGQTTHTDVAGPGDLSADGLFATVNHRFSESLEGSGRMGVEWAKYDLGGGTNARLSGSGNLCYRPNTGEFCADVALQSEVSGIGGLQREFFAGLTAAQRLGPRDEVSARAEYRRAELGALDLEASAFRLNATYARRLTSSFSLIGRVDYLSRTLLGAPANDALVLQIGITFGRRD